MKRYVTWGAVAAVASVTLALVFSGSSGEGNARVTRALAESECPEAPPAPEFGPMYMGPLYDTHIHIPHPPDGPEALDFLPTSRPSLGTNLTIADYVCTFTREGTDKVFAFFPVYSGEEETHLPIVKGTMERYPNLFIPFIMPPDRDDRPDGFPTVDASVFGDMLAVYPGLFRGYGEIGLYARGDHGGPTGAPALPPDSARLRAIYPLTREHNLVVYFHLGEGQQETFERAAAANRDINFIFHGDQLVVYRDGIQDLSALDQILYRNPNVYYGVDELYGDTWLLQPEVSKEEFLAHFENYEELLEQDVATWKGFIERHPRQVLWGTDRGWSAAWSMDIDVGLTLTRYARAFIDLLDPAAQELFAYKNAERLLAE